MKTLTSFSASKHVKLSNYRVARDPDGREVHISHLPSTKCAPIEGEYVYFVAQDNATNPVDAFCDHKRDNRPSPNEFLFSCNSEHGRRSLTRAAMEACLLCAAGTTDLKLPLSHSGRIGNVLWHLMNGMSLDAVQKKGRWCPW